MVIEFKSLLPWTILKELFFFFSKKNIGADGGNEEGRINPFFKLPSRNDFKIANTWINPWCCLLSGIWTLGFKLMIQALSNEQVFLLLPKHQQNLCTFQQGTRFRQQWEKERSGMPSNGAVERGKKLSLVPPQTAITSLCLGHSKKLLFLSNKITYFQLQKSHTWQNRTDLKWLPVSCLS